MEYAVYCDESHQDKSAVHPFMAIGGLWVPRAAKDEISAGLKAVKKQAHLNAELKWHRVSDHTVDGYQSVLDYFFDEPRLQFRAIVVDQRRLDLSRFHGGDWERCFYVYYFEMLHKWMSSQGRYFVLLDQKSNQRRDRYSELKRILGVEIGNQESIVDVVPVFSFETPLVQLADLLTGATAAAWCNQIGNQSAKRQLIEHAGERRGAALTVPSSSPAMQKFNIFRIDMR